jgi:hypothetical protein
LPPLREQTAAFRRYPFAVFSGMTAMKTRFFIACLVAIGIGTAIGLAMPADSVLPMIGQ